MIEHGPVVIKDNIILTLPQDAYRELIAEIGQDAKPPLQSFSLQWQREVTPAAQSYAVTVNFADLDLKKSG